MQLLDWRWDKEQSMDWAAVNSAVQSWPGVVETGLFVGMAARAYFGMEDGTVSQREGKLV